MKSLFFSSTPDFSSLILRLILGFVMLTHGAQKMFGWFGGYGFKATMSYFTDTMRLPWIIAFLVIFIEFFGAMGIIAGFATRIWALALLIIMVGAIITTNFKHGFFMNWFGNQAGEGFEYHVLVIGICVAIILLGSGKYSLDKLVGY
jgi:putative oxidoreductase